MNNDNFLSIKQAAELVGTSKKTIERAYKKYLQKEGLSVGHAPDIVRQEQHGS